MRADKAEFCLQLRHIEKMFKELVNQPDGKLSEAERLNVFLAYQFVISPVVTESDTNQFDQTLAEKIKTKFQINITPPKEECLVCQKPIPFEKRESGQCASGHRALRCRATLRTCFDDTLSCRWCGTHYHLDSGIFLVISLNLFSYIITVFLLISLQVWNAAFSAVDRWIQEV